MHLFSIESPTLADVGLPSGMGVAIGVFIVIAGLMLVMAFVVLGFFIVRKFRGRSDEVVSPPDTETPAESDQRPPKA